MTPYFFDVVTYSDVRHDFTGRELQRFEDAREWAETLALDIEYSDDVWTTKNVEVRDVRGALLYSAEVHPPDLN